VSVPALAQRARGAIGLRGRIVAVVLITTVATLAIAAVLLLGPLEKSLRKADEQALKKSIPHNVVKRFERLPLGDLNTPQSTAPRQLARAQQQLQDETGGAFVAVLGNAGLNGAHASVLLPESGISGDPYTDVAAVLRGNQPKFKVISIDGTQYASAVIPFKVREVIAKRPPPARPRAPAHVAGRPGAPSDHGSRPSGVWTTTLPYAIVLRKSISEIPAVVRVVTRAFLEAAAAGLVLTLILGIGLSGRLVARLRRLRRVAIVVEQDGPGSVVPVDRARDEVGDLARSLAAMQERLRQQEEARRAFVATASHELRTPLTSLDGMLELLHDDLDYADPDIADARDLVARARAQSRRLGRLAADLLDLSRMDAQVDLRSEPVELGEISRAVLAEFELVAEERGIRTSLQLRGESAWALGDPGSIARILRILVDNALRISPRGSEIRVRLRRGKVVTLSVCDEGTGVREEERDAIFQRFKRGRDTGGQAGFGLGLAIGRELARRMDGDLVLEPAGAIGATFTLTLPVAPAGDRDQGAPPVQTTGA
jgi:signal transduction histidine kinase